MNLSISQKKELLEILHNRFLNNDNRHPGISWDNIIKKLEKKPYKIFSLYEMERTGGEPDVIGKDSKTNEYIFCDCSKESPSGRRSLCYDHKAFESRKKNRPKSSAMQMADDIGIKLLTEEEYAKLQELGEFDTKTSSWIFTPDGIRMLGGAIFADFRYGKVFVYHNSAESYYSSRGFRGILKV